MYFWMIILPQPDLVLVNNDQLNSITIDGIMSVQEYWLVHPADAYVSLFTLQNGRYELLSAASLVEGRCCQTFCPDWRSI